MLNATAEIWEMRLSVIVTIAAGFLAVTGALAAIGLNMPKIATHAHVTTHAIADDKRYEELLRYVGTVDLMTTQQGVESAELRAIRLEQEIRRQETAGEDASFNKSELRMLRNRVEGLDDRARKLLNPTE